MWQKIALFLILIIVVLFGATYVFLKQRGMEKFLTNPQDTIINLPQINKQSTNTTGLDLTVPQGYSLSIFAKDMRTPRDLEIDPQGKVLTSDMGAGKVYALPEKTIVAENLNKPHGLAFYQNKLYIAETDKVSVFDYDQNSKKSTNKKKIIDLPSGGNHVTRSIVFKDNKIYVSTGSSCNVCVEKDTRRAAIWVANPDGSDFKSFAQGLRNSVFMTLHPQTGEIWATDMGRDLIGDDIPPEEINIIKEGGHYGWPYCYGNKVVDHETNPGSSRLDCSKTISPHLSFQAHSAPLGLAFVKNDLWVAYHGSWNRSVPTGYKIVSFSITGNKNPTDLITWMKGSEILGRPVDILNKENDIYISDDKAGVVYLLEKN